MTDKEKLAEMNMLLADKKLDLPDFRREVSGRGNNRTWLQKHLLDRNPNAPERLKELLDIKSSASV